MRGQTLSISQFDVQLPDQPQPVKLIGEFTLPLVPDGVPVKGHTVATFNVPQLSSLVDADLDWEDNQGQLVVMARDNPDPLLDLPWQITAQQLTISDGRWNWSASGMPMSGRVGLKVDNWQQGLEKATFTGRLNVLTQGGCGEGQRGAEYRSRLAQYGKQRYAVAPERGSQAKRSDPVCQTPGEADRQPLRSAAYV